MEAELPLVVVVMEVVMFSNSLEEKRSSVAIVAS
ncbi:hypothetical protein CCACVL1_17944 [Corchorus capsularis]|uniref:Uncharacterized protein n=1 Tax=Corchorus capsularis TaxID=210143 RepID=A0A1R3HP57_COCAP|nr:hypothetical protein CCACVL1_17944 [Corchorus capsularis]